jgi:glyoxylase-like metal-dependent hydrolase (beta-lactamase superfamily II)
MFYNGIKITKAMESVYAMTELSSVTMWLIEGDDRCLLIDTGMGLTDLHATIAEITDKPIVVVNSTGDTIFTTTVGLASDHTAPLSVASTTVSVYLDSLKKLLARKDDYDYIVPSHIPPGAPYFLEPSIVDIYIDGVENILSGEFTGNQETSDGKTVRVTFKIGGLTYNPNRL